MELININAPVVLAYGAASFVALLLNMITRGASDRQLFCVYRSSLLNPLTYIRLVGHVFGHANLQHYLGNFMLILLIGPMLEYNYGSQMLAAMILITAVVTGLLFAMMGKLSNTHRNLTERRKRHVPIF